MMTNLEKFHYMLLSKHKPLKIEIGGFQLESATSLKLLGITSKTNHKKIKQIPKRGLQIVSNEPHMHLEAEADLGVLQHPRWSSL